MLRGARWEFGILMTLGSSMVIDSRVVSPSCFWRRNWRMLTISWHSSLAPSTNVTKWPTSWQRATPTNTINTQPCALSLQCKCMRCYDRQAHPTLHGEDHPKGAQSQRCCSQSRVGGYECNVRLWAAQPLHTVQGVCVYGRVCVGVLCNAHVHIYVVTIRIRPTRELGGNVTEPETLNRALHCACNNVQLTLAN